MYDAIVVGAGPAGGQCARDLARKSRRVLLIDKAKGFLENNYSSGGAPLEVMNDFELPSSIVGTYWNKLTIRSTKEKSVWYSPFPFGPIIDFDKLRAFLSEETVKNGGDFQLGYRYQSHRLSSHNIDVQIRNQATQEEICLQTKVLIDATGSERRVLSQHNYDKDQAMAATGIEYHIQVEPAIYESFACSLNFFLGHHWMPQGYAWIFPMSPCQLKIGVIRYFKNKSYIPYEPSYDFYLNQMLTLCGPARVLDKHGKTIYYTWGQKDQRHQGPILAIGDAISSINPLGCEGIRHALVSGRQAAIEVDRFLNGEISYFNSYNQAMNRYFGWKWFLSELFMSSLFKSTHDGLMDQAVRYFSHMSNEEIMDVIFRYRFQKTLKSYAYYFASRLKNLFKYTRNV